MYYKFTEEVFSGTAVLNGAEIVDQLNKEAQMLGILEADTQAADALFQQWCMGFGEPEAILEEPTCSNCSRECSEHKGWCPDWQDKREA